MGAEIKVNTKELIERLARLQSDVDFIKKQLLSDDSFKKEMNEWEQASEEDIINWEKENL